MKHEISESAIYPNVVKCALLFLGGTAFAGIGWAMTVHAQDWPVRMIGGLSVLCFSIGAAAGLMFLVLRLLRKPVARIFDDRIEYLVPLKGRYETVLFDDVGSFAVIDAAGVKIVRAACLSSDAPRELGINSALVRRIEDIGELLNARLEEYRQNHQ